MTETTKSRNIWVMILIAGLVVILVVGIAFIANTLFGGGGSSEGPTIGVPTAGPGVASGTALEEVHVRTGPGVSYPSYGIAPKGTIGEIVGVSASGQWWVVKLPVTIAAAGQGWVNGQYVQATNAGNVPVIADPPLPPPVEVPPPPSGVPTATALEVIYIRSGPGVQYPAYGLGQKGAQGEVVGKSEDGKWWVIKLPTSLVGTGQGWVSADWVSTTNTGNVPVIPAPDQSPPVDVPPPPEGVSTAVALDYINVRSGPGIDYPSYGVAAPGASAEIIGKSEDARWWVVSVPSVASGQGWVSADWVQATIVGEIPVIPTP